MFQLPTRDWIRPGKILWFCAALLLAGLFSFSGPAVRAESPAAPIASGWILVKYPAPQGCSGVGYRGYVYYDRLDCGFGWVQVSETTPTASVQVRFFDAGGTARGTQTTTYRASETAWQFNISPASSWAAGPVTIRVVNVNGVPGNYGETFFYLNQLGATIAPTGSGYAPGDPISVAGTTFEIDQIPPLVGTQQTDVGATFYLRVVSGAGEVRGPYGPYTSDSTDGSFAVTLPGEATAGLSAGRETQFQTTAAIEVIDATYSDPLTGTWVGQRAGAGSVSLSVPPDSLLIENSYVSSVGWVKPGERYPFRVLVRNYTPDTAANAAVTIPPVDGTTFTRVSPLNGAGSATINPDGSISWTIGTVEAAAGDGPTLKTLVVEGRADTLGEDPQIVWKDIASTATLTYDGGPTGLVSMSHGPKVIPPTGGYESARYGDRPFPVVPVDYFDRKHDSAHTGETLANKINSPDVPGSTFNLFQEMSLGQLFPHGTVPSAGVASAGWEYAPGFQFSELQPQGTCAGNTYKDFAGTAVLPERIVDGWYQLPGDTGYYGSDRYGSAIVGSVTGIGPLLDIDSACGPVGKAVYDAAQIADPEINYNDFDTDKDGVVDFFMMIFVGLGGNGASQLNVPPYDNIWPHSSSLEFYFNDPDTGLKGYISDDQLQSLEEVPQCWLSTAYAEFDDCAASGGAGLDHLPVYVRVGPYNVNPESAIDRASVISHEYGHSLGLPDFYSLGSRSTYGDWNLMATDKSQHMDIFSKQELGWVVPVPLNPDEIRPISEWKDSKFDTGEIHWQQQDGTPYTLSAANGHQNIHNAEAYVAKLPARLLIDPAKVANGASPDHVWWSGSGNDFGCPPAGGHNLDIFLPELANLPAGTEVTVEFKSLWDIEWDYDYGFVLASTNGGESYQSLSSAMGYSTPAGQNPNANGCQTQYGNGLTGTTKAYQEGTEAADRLLGNYPEPDGFVLDRYDLSFAAGSATVLRFSYATDPGLARPGWFIDDLTITAGGQVLFQTDFESDGDEPRIFNGGCQATQRVAQTCTQGWSYVSASAGSPADHAYYMEMRDRSGFDLDGKGENDRAPIGFEPGLLLVITDEAHGYGNVGTDNPPAQSPVDSRPQPGNNTPNLNDAAFKQGDSYSDFGPNGHVDNYTDPGDPLGQGRWRHLFDCLSFTVDRLEGTDFGPALAPGNLAGDVTFTMGAGCATFDYGTLDPDQNAAPTAVAQARPTQVAVGELVTFDGSASFDDKTPTGQLAYEWDFDDDGMVDATGQVASHRYDAVGVYTARLRVTDGGGLTGEDTVTVTVTEANTNRPPVAVDDSATTDRETAVVIDVLANDSDPDGDSLTLVGVTDPANGTAEIVDGAIRYTPDSGFSGPDSFAYTISDGELEASARVDVWVNEPGGSGDATKATGGGWLAATDGKKINFGFNAKQGSAGFSGNLQLNDKGADVKIHLTDVTALGAVNGSCGAISAGPNALEFRGSGTYNGVAASFRVCVEDNGEPGKDSDRFVLMCTAGCTYSTSDRTSDAVIDGGNLQVRQAAGSGASGSGSNSGGGSSANGQASTLVLNPMLLSEGVIGQLQPFAVEAYGANQNPLSGAQITLTRVTAAGTESFTAVTDLTGVALFTLPNLSQAAEMIAVSGSVQSNAVSLTPLPLLP